MWELARSLTFIIVVAYITASIYDTPSNLGKNSKRETRNVIVLLLPEFGNVLDGKPCSLPCSNVEKNVIIEFIQMIDAGLMDQFRTDIIIFHEGYPPTKDMHAMRKSTKRNIDFVNIDSVFLRIPPNLDPYIEQPNWTKRGKWRYQQMIRFMVEDIFKFPVMDNVEYFMRIDMDSCFRQPFPDLFSYLNGPGRKAVYVANEKGVELASHLPGTHLLEKLVKKYVEDNNIVPTQPRVWEKAFPTGTFHTYSNNFEITSVAFFRRPEVVNFMQAVLDSKGIFLYRWGDAGLRYITMALFAHRDEVINRKYFNISYGHPCNDRRTHEPNFVDFMEEHGVNMFGEEFMEEHGRSTPR